MTIDNEYSIHCRLLTRLLQLFRNKVAYSLSVYKKKPFRFIKPKMKLPFLIVIFSGVALSAELHAEFTYNLDVGKIVIPNPPLEAAITFALVKLADFQSDAEIVIDNDKLIMSRHKLRLPRAFMFLNLFVAAIDRKDEISWETYTAVVNSCTDILDLYQSIKNEIYNRDTLITLNEGLISADIADLNANINNQIEDLQGTFDEMFHRIIENNVSGYSGVCEKYREMIEILDEQHKKWTDVQTVEPTKKSNLLEVFDRSAKYLVQIGKEIQATRTAAAISPPINHKLIQFDIITNFEANAGVIIGLGEYLDGVDDNLIFAKSKIFEDHCKLIGSYFDNRENIEDIQESDEGHLNPEQRRKNWLKTFRTDHQDIADSFQRVTYAIRAAVPQTKYSSYSKLPWVQSNSQMKYDNASSLQQLPSMRSVIFIALATLTPLLNEDRIFVDNTFLFIAFKPRFPATCAFLKAFFNSVNENVVVPENVYLSIMSNTDSISYNCAMVDQYKTALLDSIDEDSSNKLFKSMQEAIEAIRVNMDEIFYEVTMCFPDEVSKLLQQYGGLTAQLSTIIEEMENGLPMAANNADFVKAFLPLVQNLHFIGTKIEGFTFLAGANRFPPISLYMVFQLDIITRFKFAADVIGMIKACLAEMDANGKLDISMTDHEIVEYQSNAIKNYSIYFDNAIEAFQYQYSQGISFADVSNRMTWLNYLDKHFEGMSFAYLAVFRNVWPCLPAPSNTRLLEQFQKVQQDLEYLDAIYGQRISTQLSAGQQIAVQQIAAH